MLRKDDLLEVVGELYDCAIEPKRWPQALERLGRAMDCPAVSVSLQDPLRREVRLLANWGFRPGFEAAMMNALPFNPLMSSGWFMEIDQPFTGIGVLGREAYYRTRFYRDVICPHGYCDAALAVLAKSSSRFGALSMPHATKQGEWTEAQLAQVRAITPHVRRAVTIADLLDARSLQQGMLSATLDLLQLGVVLVDDSARIVHANQWAQAQLEDRRVLRRDGDHLSASDPGAAREVADAVARVATANPIDLGRTGIAIPLPAAAGSDLAAWVLPLDAGLRGELASPYAASAAVFIREIGNATPFPGELFVKRFGITPAECRVLMMLTQGMATQEVADAVGLSLPTIKSHLARLFEKTGTRGQADLMRLAVSALAPASI